MRVGSPLYGRRKGKPLAAYQDELVARLLPHLAVDVSAPVEPSRLFADRCRDVWLEVGFGAGEHLLCAAARHPDVGLIGCEPFVNGVARVLADLAGADLGNVRLHCGDAGELIDRLPDASLGRVFLFYPDPWPKRRQRKRRFVSDAMLARLARVMRPGADLRFATDIDDYAGWDARPAAALARFRVDGGGGGGLAGAVAGLGEDPLRGEGDRRRASALLRHGGSALSAGRAP